MILCHSPTGSFIPISNLYRQFSILVQELKQHIENSVPNIFEDHRRSGFLSPGTKRALMDSLLKFLVHKYKPLQKEQISPAAEAVSAMFPTLLQVVLKIYCKYFYLFIFI